MKPNIVLLITHDTGRHVSPYGIRTLHTPNCERLAKESVMFQRSFCTAPQCSPSRAAIVTGRYPHANGAMGLTHGDFGWTLNETEKPIAKLLHAAGYATGLLGFQHETGDPAVLGFDHVDLDCPVKDAGLYLSEIPQRLEALLVGRDATRPFYCQIGCRDTHRPFDEPGSEPDDSLGIHVPPYLVDGPETRRELRYLQGSVRRFDDALGAVLAVLDARGLRDNTILVVTTDHGLALPRAKGTLFDPGIETMLFMRFPGRWPAGVRRTELVSHVDLLPTLLESVGLPVPGNLQGQSFLPLLEGKSCAERREIFAEKTFHDCYDPMRCVRTRTHKYIRYFEKSTLHTIPVDVMSGGCYREIGLLRREGAEALYDLTCDPHETVNLAEDPGHQALCADLRERLVRWMIDTDDPLLRGPIPSPFYRKGIKDLLAASGARDGHAKGALQA